jgi:MFS family permease
MIALLVGGLLAVVLGQLLDHEQLNAWGWRVPFLLGLTLVPVGIYIRQRLPETASSSGPASGVLSGLWTHQRGTLLLGALAIMAPTISVYLGQYMTTYAISSLHLPAGVAAWGTAATALGGLLGTWLGGPLADRVGCRPVMVWTRIALILAYYPAFLLLERAPSAATLILVAFGLQLLASPGATAIIAMLTAAFPARRRSAGLSVCYAAAVTVFGGTSQFMVTWLIHASGDVVAPAYYAMAASVISVWAVLHLPEPDRSQSYAA